MAAKKGFEDETKRDKFVRLATARTNKIIDMIHSDSRMMPHLHLSMQSGSDTILSSMGRRHSADTVRKLVQYADGITFSWDIICGFPGETEELFNETMELVQEIKPIKIHYKKHNKTRN